ncbi:MAG: hypothetical protein ACOY4U_10590, partial [Pseudomonadota bacterium]
RLRRVRRSLADAARHERRVGAEPGSDAPGAITARYQPAVPASTAQTASAACLSTLPHTLSRAWRESGRLPARRRPRHGTPRADRSPHAA